MCDYSLCGIPNRLAVEGEPLVVYRFPTGTMGLASPSEIPSSANPKNEPTSRGIGARMKNWFTIESPKPTQAVCIPPGAQLLLRDIPERLQQQFGVHDEEVVTFVQLSATAYQHRDGVRFHRGAELLLQKLDEGQHVDVLCLSVPEATVEPVEPMVASFSSE